MPKYRNSLHVDPKESSPGISRRSFLRLLGVGAFLGVSQLSISSLLGFMYPNALKIPPSLFSIGRPQDVLATDGKVFLQKQKVFIETSSGRVRAQTAICTHLGCTVYAIETGFQCPCHGSTYDLDGRNTGGPAPRPLVYYKVSKSASGELQVDKSRTIDDPSLAWYIPTV